MKKAFVIWNLQTSCRLKTISNKSDVKRRNTLGRLDQYTSTGLRLWNSLYREVVWVFYLFH